MNILSKNIKNILETLEDEVVIESLKNAYDLNRKPDKVDNSDDVLEPERELLDAILKVLGYYMPPSDYAAWLYELHEDDFKWTMDL